MHALAAQTRNTSTEQIVSISQQTQAHQHQSSPTQLSVPNSRAFSLSNDHRDTSSTASSKLSPPTSTRTTPRPSATPIASVEHSRSPMSTPGRERSNTSSINNSSRSTQAPFFPGLAASHLPTRLVDSASSNILGEHPVLISQASFNPTEALSSSPSANTIATREREFAREREAELEATRELLRSQGSPTPTQESVIPQLRNHPRPAADPFSHIAASPHHQHGFTSSNGHGQHQHDYQHSSYLASSAANTMSATSLMINMTSSPVTGTTNPSSPESSETVDDGKTPNVYINGLPPNFLEEQLLEMTKEFGGVVSVRTFTRHVSDKPSGYGFVLFETVEAAEKCIETLRKYRNLHPSFSKQLHKIPGTVYASVSSSQLGSGPPPDSFKARMEILQDKASTNLYMEGLPLSTDEKMLSALVNPYKIMSSRFFQTRLSNPPRIIAFVRLENRTAAEEIIERLHGRPLRGLDDSGSRISVRFADTSEQREMRRMERLGREGDHSPSRITMAQAALLNLQGTQLQASPSAPQSLLSRHGFGGSPSSLSPTGSSLHSPDSIYGPSGLPLPLHSPYQHPSDLPLLLDTRLGAYADMNVNGLGATPYMRQGLCAPPHQHGYEDELAILREMQLHQRVGARSVPNRAQDGYTEVERLILQAHAAQAHQQQQQQHVRHAQQVQSQRPMRAVQKSGSSAEGGRRLLDVLPPMSEDAFHATAGGARLVESELYHLRDPSVGSSSIGSPQVLQGVATDASQLAMEMDRQLSISQPHQHQRMQTHAALTQPRQSLDGAHTRSTTFPAKYPGARTGSQSLTYGGAFESNGGLGNGYGSSLSINTNMSGGIINNTTATTKNSESVAHFASIQNHQYPSSHDNISRTSSNVNINKMTAGATGGLVSRNSIGSTSNNHSSSISKHLIGVTSPVLSACEHTHKNINNTLFGSSSSKSPIVGAYTEPNTTAITGAIMAPMLNTTHLVPPDAAHAHGKSSVPSASHTHITSPSEESDDGSPLVSPALTYSARTPATLSPATPFSGFFGHSLETFDGLATIGVAEGGAHLGSAGVGDVVSDKATAGARVSVGIPSAQPGSVGGANISAGR